MNKLKNLALFPLLSIFLLLAACSNPFQDMQSYYERGEYIQAANKAIEAMRNKELREQATAYLIAHGEQLFSKAIHKGKRLALSKNEESIYYFQNLSRVLDKMILSDIPVKNLNDYLKQSDNLKDECITNFTVAEYETALTEFQKNYYRATIYHLNNVEKYTPHYRESQHYYSQATKLALRHVSITPFFKPADLVTQFVGDALSQIISGGKHDLGTVAIPLRVANVDIPESFNSKLLYLLNKKKSQFMNFSLDSSSANIDNTNYYIDGTIDADSSNEQTKILKNTGENKAEETYTRVDYSVSIKIDSALFFTKNNKELTRISFTETAAIRQDFKGEHVGYIPKADVANKAIQQAANRYSRELLNIIDKDMDPYALSIR